MPRRGRRVRIDRGIYRDSGSGYYSIIVCGIERRLPPESSRASLYRARADLIDEITDDAPTRAAAGTLAADIPRYLALMAHLADRAQSLKAHLGAWLAPLGDRLRRTIRRHDVLTVRAQWIAAGAAPQTCNNRVSALRALYRTLDGDDARTPCDQVKALPTHRTPAVRVSDALILEVDRRLQHHETRGLLRDSKTRARFRVRAATGRRPSEIMRTHPTDVDLARRIWTPRDGKGGFTPGIYLTDDMLDAWELFIAADAWGPFDTGSMARVLRACGWPDDVRAYQLRHTVGIALSEAGVDLADVQQMMGHKDARTTRRHYVPVLGSRLQQAAEKLTGRLPWFHDDGSMPAPKTRKIPKKSAQRSTLRSGRRNSTKRKKHK